MHKAHPRFLKNKTFQSTLTMFISNSNNFRRVANNANTLSMLTACYSYLKHVFSILLKAGNKSNNNPNYKLLKYGFLGEPTHTCPIYVHKLLNMRMYGQA